MQNNASRNLWWLASYPKSGNTWVRAFLAAYETGQCDINNLVGTMADQSDYYHQVVSPVAVDKLSFEELACLHPAALTHIAWTNPQGIRLKTHNCAADWFGVPLIPPALTRGAVYIIRDPRDVAVSLANHFGVGLNEGIDLLLDEEHGLKGPYAMPHFTSSWNTHVSSWLAAQPFPVLVLRYEALQADPVAMFAAVVKHFGLPLDEERLEDAINAASFDNLQTQEKEHGFNEAVEGRFFREGGTGNWRNVLSPSQVHRIEGASGNLMRMLGYEFAQAEVA